MPKLKANALADLIPAAIFFMLGAWLLVETFFIGDEFAIGVGMDAGTYPQILSITTLALAVLLAVRAFLGTDDADTDSGGAMQVATDVVTAGQKLAGPRKVLFALLTFAVYTLLLNTLGFVVATPLMLAAIMLLAEERRLWFIVATSIALTIAIQALSFYGFSIVLPEGPLQYFYS